MTESSGIRKTYRIDLSKARNGQLERVRGRFVRIADASSSTASLKIAIQDNAPDRFEALKKGGSITEGNGFDRIYFKNEAQAGEWVRVIISDGSEDYDVDNPSISVIDEIASPVRTKGGNNRSHKAVSVGTTAVKLLDANTDRTGWKVANNGAETIYIGSDGAVTVADGDPLPAGAVTGFDDTDAVYAISGTAGQDVRITEVEAV